MRSFELLINIFFFRPRTGPFRRLQRARAEIHYRVCKTYGWLPRHPFLPHHPFLPRHPLLHLSLHQDDKRVHMPTDDVKLTKEQASIASVRGSQVLGKKPEVCLHSASRQHSISARSSTSPATTSPHLSTNCTRKSQSLWHSRKSICFIYFFSPFTFRSDSNGQGGGLTSRYVRYSGQEAGLPS